MSQLVPVAIVAGTVGNTKGTEGETMSHLTLSEYDACTVCASGRNVAAVPCGRYNGRNVYRVPVYIRLNSSMACGTIATGWYVIQAHSATDAANWFRDRITRPETEIIAIGPKGGEVHRYVGWHSAIARGTLGAARVAVQFNLI